MKKRDILSPEAPDIVAEACAWLAQIETGQLSAKDLTALREWIQRSPRHYAELRRLAQLSHEVNVLAEMAEPLRESAARRNEVLKGQVAGRQNTGRRPWQVMAAVSAAAACAALVVVLARSPEQAPAEPEPRILMTAIGEIEDVSLEDGSKIKLNTDSQVSVNFSKSERRILLEKGEAFFDVEHDPSRPFVVYAGDKSVTAVGTAFSVRWTDSDLIVTVSEGRVAYGGITAAEGVGKTIGDVAPNLTPPGAPTLLEAGQRLAISSAQPKEMIEDVPNALLSREMAWRSGFLDFENAPLRDVVREMQRYTPQTIMIADEELGDKQFGGVFRIGETSAFFDALELSFDVEVVEVDDTHILLKTAE